MKHRKGSFMKLTETMNKSIGAGLGAGFLSSALPLVLDFLNWIQPVASLVPGLGLVVGIGTFIITFFVPKNTPKTS